MSYKEKYLKYKNKYLELKKQIGGSVINEYENDNPTCPICLENYNNDLNKPVALHNLVSETNINGLEHYVCLVCFNSGRINICPGCRIPISNPRVCNYNLENKKVEPPFTELRTAREYREALDRYHSALRSHELRPSRMHRSLEERLDILLCFAVESQSALRMLRDKISRIDDQTLKDRYTQKINLIDIELERRTRFPYDISENPLSLEDQIKCMIYRDRSAREIRERIGLIEDENIRRELGLILYKREISENRSRVNRELFMRYNPAPPPPHLPPHDDDDLYS
jgi:hypothetical protein